MALKHWHPGKLVLVWVMCWMGALVLGYVGFLLLSASVGLLTVGRVGFALWFMTLVLVATPFVVTWKWFTFREKRD